jgi:hypothetical protein
MCRSMKSAAGGLDDFTPRTTLDGHTTLSGAPAPSTARRAAQGATTTSMYQGLTHRNSGGEGLTVRRSHSIISRASQLLPGTLGHMPAAAAQQQQASPRGNASGGTSASTVGAHLMMRSMSRRGVVLGDEGLDMAQGLVGQQLGHPPGTGCD